MIDLALLVGRLLLIALLYLFLLAAAKAGMGLVSGRAGKREAVLGLRVTRGPAELRGVNLPLTAPVVIGRSAGADIVIGDDFVSGKHARIVPRGADAGILEDLGSTNGTLMNGQPVTGPVVVSAGDTIEIGEVELTVIAS